MPPVKMEAPSAEILKVNSMSGDSSLPSEQCV